MALDHYVPQVHLRKFNSPALGERMYAIRKTDLRRFQPSPSDVCRIEAGNTNAYLREDRAVEEFLKTIEPKYTGSVDRLVRNEINEEAVYVVAGFVAYVMSCSPTAMRVGTLPLKKILEATARALDSKGRLPPPPTALGGKTLTDLLARGKVKFTVDPKYPQAIGIANLLAIIKSFGNFTWEVLINNHTGMPFVTSDNPVAIEPGDDIRVLNRLIPLTPNVALRILPNLELRSEDCDFSFKRFCYRKREVSVPEVSYLNEAFVRCAESIVFYRDDLPWVEPMIVANKDFRIEAGVHELRTSTGTLLINTQRVVSAGGEPSS